MAQKKTYIYEVNIGRSCNPELKEMVYARNSERAIKLCKEKYKKEKYDWYRAKKRGVSKELRPDEFFDKKEKEIIKAQPEAEAYAERNPDAPLWTAGEFVPVEAKVE